MLKYTLQFTFFDSSLRIFSFADFVKATVEFDLLPDWISNVWAHLWLAIPRQSYCCTLANKSTLDCCILDFQRFSILALFLQIYQRRIFHNLFSEICSPIFFKICSSICFRNSFQTKILDFFLGIFVQKFFHIKFQFFKDLCKWIQVNLQDNWTCRAKQETNSHRSKKKLVTTHPPPCMKLKSFFLFTK